MQCVRVRLYLKFIVTLEIHFNNQESWRHVPGFLVSCHGIVKPCQCCSICTRVTTNKTISLYNTSMCENTHFGFFRCLTIKLNNEKKFNVFLYCIYSCFIEDLTWTRICNNNNHCQCRAYCPFPFSPQTRMKGHLPIVPLETAAGHEHNEAHNGFRRQLELITVSAAIKPQLHNALHLQLHTHHIHH